MKKQLSGWQLFGLFGIMFVLFSITHLGIVALVGMLFLVASIVVGVSNRIAEEKKHEE
jgi:hypothetical protein